MTSEKERLIRRIAEEHARLERAEQECRESFDRLNGLRSELAALERPPATGRPAIVSDAIRPETPSAKVRLFRSLFRGRDEVFPRLWINTRKNTKGYAPACANEWVSGVCEKPRIRCGECPNQAFLAVDDQAILDHLQGRHVIGVYPLLQDETCWFLAADFDKSSWREDVTEFAQTCRSTGLPVAIERSRSGEGAHAWFFFAEPVAASVARKMGCYLITQTMARRPALTMQSYDRLFPNQDTLPRGGFGNLIALPLQHEAREKGNTVFLDAQLGPYADQWAFLASVSRPDLSTVGAIAREATRIGRVIGVPSSGTGDDENQAPWTTLPLGRATRAVGFGPLPAQVRAVLAQRLFVEKAGLPAALIDRVNRLAAFQNPEFYKRQRMRLSTAATPRVIACAEELSEHLALPRGCLADLKNLLDENGVTLAVEERRSDGEPLEVRFVGTLTALQREAAAALLTHDTGILVAPSGVGKTVLGTYLVARRARSALVLVHRQPLLDHWVAQLSMFLGIEPKEIGQIRGGQRNPNGRLDIAMMQSIVRGGKVDDLVTSYGHVIVDECHHVPAVSFERVLSEVKARYIVGLTATPRRRDGLHPILEMQLGPVCFSADPKRQAAKRPFKHELIVRETSFRLDVTSHDLGIQEIYRLLGADETRNRLIVDDAIRAVAEGRSPIVLTERRDHLERLAEQLRPAIRNVFVLHGGESSKKRKEFAARLAEVSGSSERLVLATGRYIGEGFDDARLDTLFLAMPISWSGTLTQYAGRLHRLNPGKREVRVFDYVDREVPVLLAMFGKRLRAYRAIGYARGEAPLGFVEPRAEPRLEYDADPLPYPEETYDGNE